MDGCNGSTRHKLHPLALHSRTQTLGQVAVEVGQYFLGIFHHRHLRAQGREDAGKFQPDDAAANDAQALGHGSELQNGCRRQDVRMVCAGNGQRAGLRTRGDDDVVGSETLTLGRYHLVRIIGIERGIGVVQSDEWILQELLNALVQRFNNTLLLLLRLVHAERSIIGSSSTEAGRLLGRFPHTGCVAQALGRNAAFVQTRAAQVRNMVEQMHAATFSSGLDSGFVTARASTYDDDFRHIVWFTG